MSRTAQPAYSYQVQGHANREHAVSNSIALVFIIAGSGVYLARLGSYGWFSDFSAWMNNNLSVNWDAFVPAAMIGVGLVLFAFRLRRA